MQDFESELIPTERHISQVVKRPSVGIDVLKLLVEIR